MPSNLSLLFVYIILNFWWDVGAIFFFIIIRFITPFPMPNIFLINTTCCQLIVILSTRLDILLYFLPVILSESLILLWIYGNWSSLLLYIWCRSLFSPTRWIFRGAIYFWQNIVKLTNWLCTFRIGERSKRVLWYSLHWTEFGKVNF